MPKIHKRRRQKNIPKAEPKPEANAETNKPKPKQIPKGGNCVICQQQENITKHTCNGAMMKGYLLVNEERDTWKIVREEWVPFCSSEEHVPKNKNHIACDKQMHAVGYLDENDIQWEFE